MKTPEEPKKTGLTTLELAQDLLARVEEATRYGRSRKDRFRRRSTLLKVATLGLSATATIILGWQDLDFWTGLAFSLVALTTVVGALEPFFAWRSLWVLMEESQYRFYRLRDDLGHYLAAHHPDELDRAHIEELFVRYQEIWARLSDRWLEFRKISDR
ncbi:SLATT domain-containing protein [Actinosynnema sp. CS-041913]|uniref:SLATT domain-containing protein n=1 Tax=Actinosynnema sp. CS-041913 TaxID=3239917 RepID=UPI003D90D166